MIRLPKIKRSGSAGANGRKSSAKPVLISREATAHQSNATHTTPKPALGKSVGVKRLPDGRVPLKASVPKTRKPFVFGGREYLAKTVPHGLDERRANRLEAHKQLNEGISSGFADMLRMASRPQAGQRQMQSGLKKAA